MSRIAHLSDLHFGSDLPALAETLADHLNDRGLDLVIVSGDLTMAARHREFRAARAFLDLLEAPTLVVPGNHDISPYRLEQRFVTPYRRWKRYVGRDLEPTFVNDDVAVFGINTARRMMLKLDWSRGAINRRQIRRLSKRLHHVPKDVVRIVVAHHPFLEDAAFEGKTTLVQRSRRALEAFTRYEIDLITSGHLHRTYSSAFVVEDAPGSGVHELGGGETVPLRRDDHRVTVIQAGTALSHRTRGETNSFNEIVVQPEGTVAIHAVVWDGARWSETAEPLATLRRR